MIDVANILASAVAIIVAISVHEFGHAFAAHLLGDDTAKNQGRMTLNPIAHIDPIGILMMIIFRFGWAKPVPVNPNNFKNYKIGNLIVSLAGVVANIITAIVCVFINKSINMYAVSLIASMTIVYNLSFAAFNLLPIPPLDGWGVISTFIPYKYYEYVYKYESMSFVILLLVLFTGLYSYILTPIYNLFWNIIKFFYMM